MKETVQDNKQKRQIEFMLQHTMTKADQQKMIREKLERARVYSEALRKREALIAEYR